jgi:hypothetical protein
LRMRSMRRWRRRNRDRTTSSCDRMTLSVTAM